MQNKLTIKIFSKRHEVFHSFESFKAYRKDCSS